VLLISCAVIFSRAVKERRDSSLGRTIAPSGEGRLRRGWWLSRALLLQSDGRQHWQQYHQAGKIIVLLLLRRESTGLGWMASGSRLSSPRGVCVCVHTCAHGSLKISRSRILQATYRLGLAQVLPAKRGLFPI